MSTTFGDDNSLLSTTIYGELIVADVPSGYTGFTSESTIPQYAYAQFDRNITVFGKVFTNNLQGITVDANNNITGTGDLTVTASNFYIPTAATSDSSTKAASTAFVKNQSYAPLASPTFTGTVTIPTVATSDNSTAAASTAWVKAQGYATSSFSGYSSNNTWTGTNAFSGTVTVPTPGTADSSTNAATTAFVKNQGYTTLTAVQSNSNTFSGTCAFSGTVTATTQTASDNSTKLATTAYVKSQGFLTSSNFNGYSATNTWSGVNTFSNTTSSTSITTGAVVCSGGLGVGAEVNAGSYVKAPTLYGSTKITCDGQIAVSTFTTASDYTAGTIVTQGGVGVGDNISVANNITAGGAKYSRHGLAFKIYSGYFNDTPTWFSTASLNTTISSYPYGYATHFANIATGTDNRISAANTYDSYSVEWFGYF